MATTDDVDCLSTLCQALREVLADPSGLTSESEEQVRELFALLPQVFATDTHAGRTSQLLHACYPLHVVSQFLSTRWLCPPSVRICSMRCLMEVSTGAAVLADHTGRLRAVVGEQLREASAAAHLLNIIMTTHSVPEASTASEVLFVLAMTITSIRDDLRLIDGGIAKLCARALQRPNAPQVQSYLAGVVRLLAEHFADILSGDDVHFVPMVFSALAAYDAQDPSKPKQENSNYFGCCTSRRAAVLFIESVTEVLAAFPSSYQSAVRRKNFDHYSILDPHRSIVDVLHLFLFPGVSVRANTGSGSSPRRLAAVHHQTNEATSEDCTEAAWALYRLILSIEGRSSGRNAVAVVYPILSDVALWKDVIVSSVSAPSSRPKLCLLREAVCSALSVEAQRPLVTACLETLPVLCSMLVPERSNALCMREAAVILGVLLTKSPAARRELRRLVSGYESWAESLCARIHQLLRTAMVFTSALSQAQPASAAANGDHQTPSCYPAEAFDPRRLLIVDAFQTILNDGDQAQHVDMLREERVAQALLHEQRRRFANSAAPSQLDISFIDNFIDSLNNNNRTASGDGTLSTRARELCCRLGLVLMIEATNLALTDEGAVEDSMDDVVGTVGVTQPTLATARELAAAATPRNTAGTPSTPRSAAAAASGAARAPRATSPGSSRGTPLSSMTANQRGSASRYQEWVDQHIGRPKPRTLGSVFGTVDARSPFRPSGSKTVNTPLSSKSPSFGISSNTAATPRGGHGGALKDHMNGKSILEVVKEAPLASDEYLSMAIMMHLPIRYGPHYNRGAKAAVRKVNSPQGVFVQPIRRNNAQTWSAADVQVGELHVIFVPFHKLSCRVVEDEIMAVDKHLVELSKRLVTTPNVQRTRRWFLQDMVHEVLPKTELLLRDLLDLLYKFGVDDVVYQLSLVRVADEGRRQTGGAFAAAVDIADTAMPNEILRLSTGAFRDILHSGNILFAVQELRAHYFDSQGVPTIRGHHGHVGHHEGGMGGGPGLQWSSLTEVDREIRELEQKVARGGQPHAAGGSGGPDVGAYASSGMSPQRYMDPIHDLHDATSNDLMSQYRQGMAAGGLNSNGGGGVYDDATSSLSPPPSSWGAAADVADMYSRVAN
ncbi:Hypothetical protein, putative [Bodo saltans]|uniref:Uncharacterized protein n=1 Tax=Bodo saltans TaxID=75058 RepID=A0A0S4J0Q3_BODSA|nr:Hypothetical protein, putative [Bodo saltans]|eukprot:CUG74982.1 Hypothetical protein, putative [Bodo saltans]